MVKENKSMDHLEAIVEIKNVVSPKFIDKIIPLIDHKAKKKFKCRVRFK